MVEVHVPLRELIIITLGENHHDNWKKNEFAFSRLNHSSGDWNQNCSWRKEGLALKYRSNHTEGNNNY